MEGWVVGSAATVAAITALALRRTLPPAVTVVMLGLTSAVLGWGVIRLRPDPSALEVLLVVGAMALLGPVHVRLLLGPFRRR